MFKPQASAPSVGRVAQRIPVDAIAPNPDQPRRCLNTESVRALAASIRRHGLLSQVLVPVSVQVLVLLPATV